MCSMSSLNRFMLSAKGVYRPADKNPPAAKAFDVMRRWNVVVVGTSQETGNLTRSHKRPSHTSSLQITTTTPIKGDMCMKWRALATIRLITFSIIIKPGYIYLIVHWFKRQKKLDSGVASRAVYIESIEGGPL